MQRKAEEGEPVHAGKRFGGLRLSDALPIANRAGGIAVGKFGNATLTYEELFA